jgi:hypothetical protein
MSASLSLSFPRHSSPKPRPPTHGLVHLFQPIPRISLFLDSPLAPIPVDSSSIARVLAGLSDEREAVLVKVQDWEEDEEDDDKGVCWSGHLAGP